MQAPPRRVRRDTVAEISLQTYVALHARVALLGAGAAVAVALARGGAPGNSIQSLADAMGEATSGHVAPQDVRWEPSGGELSDYVLGRWALVLSSATPGGPRDVWRVRVRVSPEGHPVALGGAHDLTDTPLGDDHALVVRGDRAAFATYAYGQEQSVTALYLGGEGAQNTAIKPLDRATAYVTNLQQTGSGVGVGRIDVSFEQPPERLGLTLGDSALAIDLGDRVGTRHAALDLVHGDLAAPVHGVHAQPARHLPKRFIFWAVDTVRAVTGPAPIAWLEEKVFAARDTLKQTAFKLHGPTDTDTLAAVPPKVLDTANLSDDSAWPPADIPSIWKTAEPGEGQWKPFQPAWMKRFPAPAGGKPPPAFYQTFVRPDEARPYTHIILVAMDMRQLDLQMEAGTEDPKPLTGAAGPGRLPRDPAVLTRVVAAFNGAFKTEHGNYGMMVHKRVLLPPQPSAATVVVLADGRAGFGTWGNTTDIGGLLGIPDADIDSFRQNLDPLVDGGKVNPTKRLLWGYTLPGTTMETERSAMCVTRAGHMMYGWGDDTNATSLGKALLAAGCDYAIHLDMNPHHTGFIFTTIHDLKTHDYHSELLTPLMGVSTDRYIEYAPKDFFYMLMRDPTPAPLDGVAWEPDAGTQPPPAWSPGLWQAGVTEHGAAVSVVSVVSGRATFAVAAGTAEPDAGTGSAPPHEIDAGDEAKVVMTVGMGVARDDRPRGLIISGKNVFPVRRGAGMGVLVVHRGGRLAILTGAEALEAGPGVDAVELPLVLDGGQLTTDARLSFLRKADGAQPHAVLGIAPDGRVMVARGDTLSPAPLGEALAHARCTRAVLLDRGVSSTAPVRRAGTGAPPVARDPETRLFVMAKAMKPRAFHFEARK